jgi:hypothetical protein
MLQAPPVAAYFGTLGYLIPIISVLSMVIMPRGKFMMNLLLNALAVCVGSAVSMLALWSAVQARQNTAGPASQPAAALAYNSSQSAVCAIWLFANIWFVNVVRAKLPAFNLPVITYSILVNVSATFGPMMTTTAAAQIFVKQLITAMLAALGLGLGVNLLVFPVSSRLVVFKELAGAIGLLRKLVSLQKVYLASLEPDATFDAAMQTEVFLGKGDGEAHQDEDEPKLTKEAEAAKALEETGAKMRELAGKMHADLPFAKRDIAWGKLDAKDLSEMYKLFRNVYVPVYVQLISPVAPDSGLVADFDRQTRNEHHHRHLQAFLREPRLGRRRRRTRREGRGEARVERGHETNTGALRHPLRGG